MSYDDLRTELAVLRAEFVAYRALVDRTVAAGEKAVVVALDANGRRLDAMNEFRSTVEDILSKTMPRTDSEARHRSHEERMDREFGVLRDRMSEATRPNYVMVIALLSIGATFIGSAWVAVGLKIDGTVSPVLERVSHIQAVQDDVRIEVMRLRDWRAAVDRRR